MADEERTFKLEKEDVRSDNKVKEVFCGTLVCKLENDDSLLKDVTDTSTMDCLSEKLDTELTIASEEILIADSPEMIEVKAKQILDDVLDFRDQYFESHSISQAIRKRQDVSDEVERALVRLDFLGKALSPLSRTQALYLTLRGRIKNANQTFSEAAFQDLSKAIKLDPERSDAWNALGECYYQKKDLEESKNCFEGSLKRSKNKEALRNLSIVMRQLVPEEPEEKMRVVLGSVERAKEAVALDTNDGMSWYILGTAYLSLFFLSNQNPKILRQSLIAYSQAEKDINVKHLPDLHYNRAMAQKFMEEYQNAITGFHLAHCLEPEWKEACDIRDNLLSFLLTLQSHVSTKGKIKGKKLNQMVSTINAESGLGPFSGGSYQNHLGKTVELQLVSFKELKQGDNNNKVVLGKVVSSFNSDCITAFAFTMVDTNKDCVAVTMYNLKAGIGVIIGDTVAVAEPFMENIAFEFDPASINSADGKQIVLVPPKHCQKATFEFSSIRVPSPVVVVVNGKKWGRDKEVFTSLKINSQPVSY